MTTPADRRQAEIKAGAKFLATVNRLQATYGPLGWTPNPAAKAQIEAIKRAITACKEQERLAAKDREDLWRKPRLQAIGPAKAVPLADTPESRLSAGFTQRNYLTPKYRRKRGGRKNNRRYYRQPE